MKNSTRIISFFNILELYGVELYHASYCTRSNLLQIVFSTMQTENLRKKLPWLKYDQKKALFQASKDKEKETKRLLNEAAAKSEALKKPVE